jgi:hypothetical protein
MAICTSFLKLSNSFAPLTRLLVLLVFNCWALYILRIVISSHTSSWQTFSHSVACLFFFFDVQKLFSLMLTHLSVLSLIPELLESCSESCCLCLSSNIFLWKLQNFRPYVKVFDPLWVDICTRWDIEICFSLLPLDIWFSPTLFVKAVVFYPTYILGAFVKNHGWGYLWVLSCIPLVYMSVYACVCVCVCVYSAHTYHAFYY